MKKIIFIIIFLTSSANTLFAAGVYMESLSSISWSLLIISLFGGLALFLYGMEKMSEGRKSPPGTKYRFKHLEWLHQERKESVKTHEIHMELMDLLKQINVYTGNIAKTFLNMGG